MIREVSLANITENIARLCQEANYGLPDDVVAALRRALEREESPTGRQVLAEILENAKLAKQEKLPVCQDCGVAVVYLEIGQDVHLIGGNLADAVNQGVRRGYTEGYLRKSMVSPPHSTRRNTNDNTPAITHTEIVPGDRVKITLLPKGGGAENMSALYMLTPGQGEQGVVNAVIETVKKANANACPPLIVGVGIGGTAEKAMSLAKHSLLRPVGEANPDPETATLEKKILEKVNNLGIGPQGFGGRVTALAVHIETWPAHIASLPVAVNLQCHSSRHREVTI